jgi:hypothetical protein
MTDGGETDGMSSLDPRDLDHNVSADYTTGALARSRLFVLFLLHILKKTLLYISQTIKFGGVM